MYLEKNKEFWEKGYTAANVDHSVFRFFGRIVKPDFSHLLGSKLLDFGCGQGAAVDFFVKNGFHALGVDVSEHDISVAKIRYPSMADRFLLCEPDPNKNEFYGFKEDIGIVTAMQSLYYFNDNDFAVCLQKLYASMRRGGLFYCTMKGTRSTEYYNNSQDIGGGLRRVSFQNDRIKVDNHYMSFVEDEEQLKEKFSLFTPIHIGYYCAKFRSDEGDGFHYTFCGLKE